MEVYSRLGLTSVKYHIDKLSRVEKEQVTVRINANILRDWEKM